MLLSQKQNDAGLFREARSFLAFGPSSPPSGRPEGRQARMAGKRTGRPSKLSPEVTLRLYSAIRQGSYLEDACFFAGIDYSTFRRWMIRGEEAESGEYRELYLSVKRLEASVAVELVGEWRAKMDSWRSIAAFLEKRFPERFGRRRVEIAGEGGGPIEIDLASAKEALAVKLEKLARRAGEDAGDSDG